MPGAASGPLTPSPLCKEGRMAVGMIIGAWLLSRQGWGGVIGTSAVTAVLSLIDSLFGLEIGRRLAEVTIRLFG